MKKNNIRALLVATTLVVPFAVYPSAAQAAVTIEANKTEALAPDRIYDAEIKVYKDQKNEPSMVSQYLKDPKLKIENGKKFVIVTVQDSDYFQYLRVEDMDQPGVFHDVEVLSEDKRKNGTKVVQFEIGELSKKYNMQMHILIPAIGYNNKYQVQFEIINPNANDNGTENPGDGSNPGDNGTENPVDSKNVITDKKLRQLVNQKVFNREDLDTPITQEELLQVKELFLNTNEILDYSALQYMPNLEFLTITRANIKDLTFFSNLKQVKKLAIRSSGIEDVTPLTKMDNLEYLDLSSNKISNVAPLSEMKNVKSLFLSGNQIEDITALSKMEQLETLNIANNKVSNVAPLSGLKNLTYLSLSGNQIEDITPLYTLPLTDLIATRNKIKDISGIHQLNQLEDLSLGKNQIEDVTPISQMSHLKVLELDNNEIKDIASLSKLANLEKINLEANYISDLSPISKLEKLIYVNFVANEIRDVRPVVELSKQAYINVQNQKVFLEETEVNKEVKIPIYEKDGKISTKIRLKSEGGEYNNDAVKWSTPGEKVYEFGVKDPFADTGIFYTGTVIQNVVAEGTETPGGGDITAPSKPEVHAVTDKTTEVTGKTEPNAVVSVFVDTTKIGSAVADKDGNFTVQIPAQKGETELTVIAADKAGNKSEPAKVTVKQSYSGWTKIDNKWYYYNTETPQTNWSFIDNQWYFFNKEGIMQTNWQQINGTWYYLNENGAMQTGWQQINGIWYYLNENGTMQTGWQQINGTWYYLNENGTMQTGWKQIGGIWYCLNENGAMQTGWKQIGGTWYFFNASGTMQTGWKQIGGTWYFLNENGAMQTGWKQIGGTWYFFNTSGTMQTGWKQIGGTWYYLNKNGAMQTGWQQINSTWYYFYNDGHMAANTTIEG
ncbi:leucine-rich repeat domain-containing protein [Bacillus manliponensis]|uniref:leucine-rich repeat domain-containing protein n=1 Tax=Bacillus manliponensis TaxID=574376 RepID=UPI000A06F7A0|nr:leucine-rich repeat domain-containing protein [Bacillus manliponensis]